MLRLPYWKFFGSEGFFCRDSVAVLRKNRVTGFNQSLGCRRPPSQP
jgi:hypothetical protein